MDIGLCSNEINPVKACKGGYTHSWNTAMLVCCYWSFHVPWSIHQIHVPFNYLAFSSICCEFCWKIPKAPRQGMQVLPRLTQVHQRLADRLRAPLWRLRSSPWISWRDVVRGDDHDLLIFPTHEWVIISGVIFSEWWFLAIHDLLTCWLRISHLWMMNHCMMKHFYYNHLRHRGNNPQKSEYIWDMTGYIGMSNWYYWLLIGYARWGGLTIFFRDVDAQCTLGETVGLIRGI